MHAAGADPRVIIRSAYIEPTRGQGVVGAGALLRDRRVADPSDQSSVLDVVALRTASMMRSVTSGVHAVAFRPSGFRGHGRPAVVPRHMVDREPAEAAQPLIDRPGAREGIDS